MKKLKSIFLIILVILLIILGISIVNKVNIAQDKINKTSEIALLKDNLVGLSEWTTLKYEYSNVIISRTEKNLSLMGLTDINYAEAIKLIQYSGYLKAGTDLSRLEITYDDSSNQLLIKVAKSKVLDNVVETEKTRVEDIKGNIFSDYPTQTVFDEINAHKKQLEEKKISDGLLEEADNRIKLLLSSFLEAKGYQDVMIEFY